MNEKLRIGFIGTGDMGSPMCMHLLEAGFPLNIFDRDPARLGPLLAAGAHAADDASDLATASDVILTSLPSSEAWLDLLYGEIIPVLQPNQILIDFGTVCPHRAREAGHAVAETGAHLLDAPVSGGPEGVRSRRLYVFVGGDAEIFGKVRPILETVAGPDLITHCGPCGSGQGMKGVNQLMMALSNAAILEAVAFGVNSGLSPDSIAHSIGDTDPLRQKLAAIVRTIAAGHGNDIDYKFRELPYFLEDARVNRFPLPLTQALHSFCVPGERITIQDKRPAPSLWHELTGATHPSPLHTQKSRGPRRPPG